MNKLEKTVREMYDPSQTSVKGPFGNFTEESYNKLVFSDPSYKSEWDVVLAFAMDMDEQLDSDLVTTPLLKLTKVHVSNAERVGTIWHVPVGQSFTLTGLINLPNYDWYIVMAEKLTAAQFVVDDVRFRASVADGAITVVGKFDVSGNYFVSAERMNRAFAYLQKNMGVTFETIEFNAYID